MKKFIGCLALLFGATAVYAQTAAPSSTYTIIILSCAVNDSSGYGCGPRAHLTARDSGGIDPVIVGTAPSEGQCFMAGNKALPNYPDTATVFHKVICSR